MIIDRDHFFSTAKPLFGRYSQAQVDAINQILDAFEEKKPDEDEQAYMLATAFHETAGTMQPVMETRQRGEKTNPSVDTAIARLESSWKRGRLPWVRSAYWRKDPVTGKSYLGRGLVQITHKANYKRLSPYVGVDLVKNPDAALEMPIAIKIMMEGMRLGLFTGRKLDSYLDGIDESDKEDYAEFVKARQIINGKESDEKVADHAMVFKSALRYK